MKTNNRISTLSRHMIAMILTVSLVAGIAGFESGSFAATFTGSPFNNTKSSYMHNTRFDNSLVVNGVDVSYFQSNASDWKKAKLDGCDYAIMRVSYTTFGPGTLNIDSKFVTHFNKAKAAGVMKGVYVFSQAKNATEATKEAQYAVNRLKALGIGPEDLELPVYMDYEFAGPSRGINKGRLYGISSRAAIQSATAFCDVIRANGYDPGIYACTNFFTNYLANGKTLASDIDLWCAQYYDRNESGSNYSKWQYTSTAHVDGILYYSTNKIGSTDADFWYLNKEKNPSPITEIYGNTTLKYTGNPVKPKLEIYAGNTLLKEGVDYIVGGINNVKKSSSGAYAYVKGIGTYSGYALVPIKISSKYIAHKGLSCVGGVIFGNTQNSTYVIGNNSFGSYVRGVAAGTTVKKLLRNLKLKEGYSRYHLEVISATGKKVDEAKTVSTGMMIGVFNEETLVATADITVKGDTINDRGANYLNTDTYIEPATATTSLLSIFDNSSNNNKITVKKTRIIKLEGGERCFTVKAKLLGRKLVNGYQVRYSTKKSMSRSVLKTLGNKYHLRTKTIKKLKKNKTYYVQVRAYKIVDGNYYYSAWSKKKKVRTL